MRIVIVGPRWRWPWLHWCMFDRECQGHGCPADLYVHPLGIVLRFKESRW